MDDLQDRLVQLIDQWRQTSLLSSKAKLLQQILSTMEQSGKIWRGPGVSRDLYQEALQNNWLWFIEKLSNYDSSRAKVMYWFNQHLKWKISDLQKRRPSLPIPDNFSIDSTTGESGGFQTSLNRMKHCMKNHQPQLRRRSMQGRADVSCDLIMAALLERVEHASSSQALSDIFAQLAKDWQLDRTAFRRFCSSSCFNLLRQLCPSDQIR